MRKTVIAAAVAAASLLALAGPGLAASPTSWRRCGLAQGKSAAIHAGVYRAIDRDPTLIEAFSFQKRPSAQFQNVAASLCGDFDGDGRTDRAVQFDCCTSGSPAPWAVLHNTAHGWRIVYSRLDNPAQIQPDGRLLQEISPIYKPSDALCCPSNQRTRTLRWTGTSFKVSTTRAPAAKPSR